MHAFYSGSGIYVNLNKKDKEEGMKTGKLKCIFEDGNKPEIVIHIAKNVPWQQPPEEPGFHITSKPKGSGYERKKRYDIHITREIFRELTSAEDFRGSHYTSRCSCSRVDFSYYP